MPPYLHTGLLGKLSSLGARAGQARVLPQSAPTSPRTSGYGAAPQQSFPAGLYHQGLHQIPPRPAAAAWGSPQQMSSGRPPLPSSRVKRASDPGQSIPIPGEYDDTLDLEQTRAVNPPNLHAGGPAGGPVVMVRPRRSTAGDVALPLLAPLPRSMPVPPLLLGPGHVRQPTADNLMIQMNGQSVARPGPVQLQGWASNPGDA